MTAKIQTSLRPLSVPKFVALEFGGQYPRGESPSIPVKDLPTESIDALVADWLDEVYALAGMVSPWVKDDKP